MSMVLRDVCDGVIELRDHLYDLENVIEAGNTSSPCTHVLAAKLGEGVLRVEMQHSHSQTCWVSEHMTLAPSSQISLLNLNLNVAAGYAEPNLGQLYLLLNFNVAAGDAKPASFISSFPIKF
ncbi:uncharacterized protein F5147DRAFT_761562 [Suillus discolor]|uniref:Uncharacterized protein n=1 Tax=Suillus discolor TaxID=1912936 RepID=A0A9P7F4Q4_9AGAM|nr:uncharacterized protein F5147DRAFT_761562 [Suillus discolor]KAG2106724.1 hypothetical protein F5147DRAFT_761562 [Suillus discolor]